MSSYGVYDGSPLGRFLQLVMRTFAIGTFFGVHVRMYWVAACLVPLLFLQSLWPLTTGLEALVLAAICSVGLFVVIWTHEMGHIAAGWRYRIRSDLITLSPLGGVAHMNAAASTPKEELVITLAGPAVHLVWLAVLWPLQWLLPTQVLAISGWRFCPVHFTVWYLVTLNTSLFLFNLLPIFPLDGGRVLRALLSMRVHANLATMWATTVGVIGGSVLAVLGLFRPGLESTIGVVLGLSCISASLQERRLARHVLVYRQHRRELWEMDPDAWKRGGEPLGTAAAKPSRFARWRRERAERQAAARISAEAELNREVDAILERVHQVGMSALSDREKAVLKRASQRRRGAG